jgi:uncharacterized phiE125 gp8 family phage protein
VVFASGVATADGEYAEVVVDWLTVVGSVGVLARAGNLAGAARGYMAFLTGAQVSILRLDNSTTFAPIQAAAAHVPTPGTHTYRVTVTGTGASVAIEVKADGVVIMTGTDTGGARLTAPNGVGLYFDTTNSDLAGPHVTDVLLEDPNAAAPGAFTIVSPAASQIAQRSGTTGTIGVTGTYTGAPTSIEARLVLDGTSTPVSGFDWSTKVASPSGSAFAFDFAAVPEGAWYNVQVRDSAIPGAVVTSGKCGVGALVALIGQSNAWLWFARGDSTLTPDARLRVIGSGNDNGIPSTNAPKVWAVPATATMNGAIACGNKLVSTLNTLVAMVDVTWDGSGLTVSGNGGQWVPTATAGQPYARAKTFLQTITSTGIDSAVIVNGETDAAGGVSQVNFYNGMTTLISALRADFGANIPIITPLLGKRTDGAVTDANAQAVRNAQVQKAADTGIYRVEREDLPMNADGVHLDPTGFTGLSTRCGQARAFAAGAVSFYRGPRIASVAEVSAQVFDVTLTHEGGTDFTPTSGITGWRVLDGASPISVSSAVRQATNKVRLTLASDPAAAPIVQYLYGTSPIVTGVLLDNSSLALPLEFNNGVMSSSIPPVSIGIGWTEADDLAAIAATVTAPGAVSAALGWTEADDSAAVAATVTAPGVVAVAVGWTEADDTASIAATVDAPAPAGTEPITLAEAKAHLRVVFDDEDAYISTLITAAREMAEGRTQRAIVLRDEVLALDCFATPIRLPYPPLRAVTAIDYDDQDGAQQTLDDTAYRVNDYVTPARITRASGATWPTTAVQEAAVRVRYSCGYPTPSAVPTSLRQWMLLAIGALYENRESVTAGVQTYALPEDFMALLLQPHVVYM